jgi:hypothetical protein
VQLNNNNTLKKLAPKEESNLENKISSNLKFKDPLPTLETKIQE